MINTKPQPVRCIGRNRIGGQCIRTTRNAESLCATHEHTIEEIDSWTRYDNDGSTVRICPRCGNYDALDCACYGEYLGILLERVNA